MTTSMHTKYLLLIVLLVPAAAALEFLAPEEGATYVGTTAVQFEWNESGVNFTISGTSEQLNSTSKTITLEPGLHTATITKDNRTASRTVIVNNAPTQTITVSTDKQSYEAGESARIRIDVGIAGQLNLTVQRNNHVVDNYAVNVQQRTDFLYPLHITGTYSVLVNGQGATALTSFSVANTTLGVTMSGSTTATAGRVITFTSAASGGTAPYTHYWQFSDNTTSSQQNADHVFDQPGNYTVMLLVQDANGKQASTSQVVAVRMETYDLEVTVMTQRMHLIKDAAVAVSGPGGGQTDITNVFGESNFEDLSAGNYTVNVTYTDPLNSSARYVNSTHVALNGDVDLVMLLSLPLDEPDAGSTDNSNNTNESTGTNSTEGTNQDSADGGSARARSTGTGAASNASLAQAQENDGSQHQTTAEMAATANELVHAREKASAQLTSIQENVLRSDEKRQLLETLDMLNLYDRAAAAISRADTAESIAAALETVPQEVTILSKDTLVEQFSKEELELRIEQYLTDAAISPRKLQREYEYNIERLLSNTTFTLKRTVVRVAIPASTSPAVHTVFSRTIDAPAGTSFVEYLPEGYTVDDIHSPETYDEVTTTAASFNMPTYTYTVIGEAPREQAIIPLPEEFMPPPSLLGFVALGSSSFGSGSLYIILVGALIAAGVTGNIVLRRRSPPATGPFTELAELTLTLFEQGNHAAAAKYVQEMETIHAALPQADRAATADIVVFIKDTAAVHSFRSSVEHLATLVELQDITGLATAYERVVQQYEQLPPARQQQEQQLLESAHETLEAHLRMEEA